MVTGFFTSLSFLKIKIVIFCCDFSTPTKVQKRKPLPKLVYHLFQDKKLKDMLKQHGLSTHGDRKALVNRHQR
jgi:hypothetical protein